MTMRGTAIALVLVAAAFATGCGDDDGDDGGAGGGPGDGSGGPEIPSGASINWLDARAGEGQRRVRIGYETDPCTRARRAIVSETDKKVTITLHDPQRDPNEECIQLAKPGCVTVALERARGSRRVVDGSPGAFPPRVRRQDRRPFKVFGDCPPVRLAR